MDAKNLKCVIFDFDSTLYVNGNWDNEDDYWQGYLDYAKIKGVTVSEICEKYSSSHKMKSLCRYTRDIGFDDAVFFEYSDKFLYDMTNENLRAVDNNLLEELKKYYKIFLISDSTPGYLRHYMKEFKPLTNGEMDTVLKVRRIIKKLRRNLVRENMFYFHFQILNH